MNDKTNKAADKIDKILWIILAVVVIICVVVIVPLTLLLGPDGLALGMLISSVISAIVVTVILIMKKEAIK